MCNSRGVLCLNTEVLASWEHGDTTECVNDDGVTTSSFVDYLLLLPMRGQCDTAGSNASVSLWLIWRCWALSHVLNGVYRNILLYTHPAATGQAYVQMGETGLLSTIGVNHWMMHTIKPPYYVLTQCFRYSHPIHGARRWGIASSIRVYVPPPPPCTHCDAQLSFPARDCNCCLVSFFDMLAFCDNSFSSVSFFSWSSIDLATVSRRMPKKVRRCTGPSTLLWLMAKPNVLCSLMRLASIVRQALYESSMIM